MRALGDSVHGSRTCAIGGLLLVIVHEACDQVGLVARDGEASFSEELLQLGDLEGVVVGHCEL